MLETTLNTKFAPGTNVSGDLACADWRFILPHLEPDNLLFLGIPSVRSVSVLSTMTQRLHVVGRDQQGLRELHQAARQRGIRDLHCVAVEEFAELPFPDHCIALIWLVGDDRAHRPLHAPALIAELSRVLSADGVIYYETYGLTDNFVGRRSVEEFSMYRFGTPRTFWLTPPRGEMRTALPAHDSAVARHFFRHVLYGQTFTKRLLSRAGNLLSRLGLFRFAVLRRGILIQRAGVDGRSGYLPPYLVALARRAGIEISTHRFGLSARGKYNSNKVAFHLFAGSSKVPDIIVKMTRVREFNYRLENEYRMLSLLTERGFVSRDTYPHPMFFDYYGNLAVLGEKAVVGRPFRDCTNASTTCPLARQAIDWIIHLGGASADHSVTTPEDVAASLEDLLHRFVGIYRLTDVEEGFLRDQISRIRRGSSEFPLVLQHGDPGTWNLMISRAGKVVFLDWEAGEREGMPLWDLFYFVRSFGSWMSRVRGGRDPLAAFARHFLSGSPLSILLAGVTRKYCDAVHLDRSMVEPLFYTCWMHRALKECARLPVESVQSGHYFNLLRLCIAQRERLVSEGFLRAFSKNEN